MTRTGFADLVAVRLDVPLDAALLAVDASVPRDAYDEHDEIPPDDVEIWIDRIADDLI